MIWIERVAGGGIYSVNRTLLTTKAREPKLGCDNINSNITPPNTPKLQFP